MTGQQFYNTQRTVAREMLNGMRDDEFLVLYEPWEFLEAPVKEQWERFAHEQTTRDRPERTPYA